MCSMYMYVSLFSQQNSHMVFFQEPNIMHLKIIFPLSWGLYLLENECITKLNLTLEPKIHTYCSKYQELEMLYSVLPASISQIVLFLRQHCLLPPFFLWGRGRGGILNPPNHPPLEILVIMTVHGRVCTGSGHIVNGVLTLISFCPQMRLTSPTSTNLRSVLGLAKQQTWPALQRVTPHLLSLGLIRTIQRSSMVETITSTRW